MSADVVLQNYVCVCHADSSGYDFEMGPAVSTYLTRHGSNLSFYELAGRIASPTVFATVQSGNINRPVNAFPAWSEYATIWSTCTPPGTPC